MLECADSLSEADIFEPIKLQQIVILHRSPILSWTVYL